LSGADRRCPKGSVVFSTVLIESKGMIGALDDGTYLCVMKVISMFIEPFERARGDSQWPHGIPNSQDGNWYVEGSVRTEGSGYRGVGIIV
jgi:hypothetical protein